MNWCVVPQIPSFYEEQLGRASPLRVRAFFLLFAFRVRERQARALTRTEGRHKARPRHRSASMSLPSDLAAEIASIVKAQIEEQHALLEQRLLIQHNALEKQLQQVHLER